MLSAVIHIILLIYVSWPIILCALHNVFFNLELNFWIHSCLQVNLSCVESSGASCYCGETVGGPHNRIMEGQDASLYDAPWIVRLWLLYWDKQPSLAAKKLVHHLYSEWMCTHQKVPVYQIFNILWESPMKGTVEWVSFFAHSNSSRLVIQKIHFLCFGNMFVFSLHPSFVGTQWN
jgi:hypothetical protein